MGDETGGVPSRRAPGTPSRRGTSPMGRVRRPHRPRVGGGFPFGRVPRPRGETRQRAVRVRRPTERRRSERHPLEVLVLHQRPERDGVERRYAREGVFRGDARGMETPPAPIAKRWRRRRSRDARNSSRWAPTRPRGQGGGGPRGRRRTETTGARTQEDDASRRRVGLRGESGGGEETRAVQGGRRRRVGHHLRRTRDGAREVHRGVKGEATGVRGDARRAERGARGVEDESRDLLRGVASPSTRSTLSESFRAKRAAYLESVKPAPEEELEEGAPAEEANENAEEGGGDA